MDTTPDAGRSGDHYGQNDGGEELTVGEAQQSHRGERVQDHPNMSQNDADVSQKAQGILVQTQADIAGHDGMDGRALLAERLQQAGIALADDEFEALVARL